MIKIKLIFLDLLLRNFNFCFYKNLIYLHIMNIAYHEPGAGVLKLFEPRPTFIMQKNPYIIATKPFILKNLIAFLK